MEKSALGVARKAPHLIFCLWTGLIDMNFRMGETFLVEYFECADQLLLLVCRNSRSCHETIYIYIDIDISVNRWHCQ